MLNAFLSFQCHIHRGFNPILRENDDKQEGTLSFSLSLFAFLLFTCLVPSFDDIFLFFLLSLEFVRKEEAKVCQDLEFYY